MTDFQLKWSDIARVTFYEREKRFRIPKTISDSKKWKNDTKHFVYESY